MFRKKLFTDTVSANKNYFKDTVSSNKNYVKSGYIATNPRMVLTPQFKNVVQSFRESTSQPA